MVDFDTDVISHVYHSVLDRAIGQASRYTGTPHPGSGKKIEGWKWDQRTWPDVNEFRAVALAPSIWDPQASGIDEEHIQSGYGDNKDLLLLDVEEVALSGVDVWAPRLHHGYFYIRDEEWYLYSDSYLTEYFTATGVEAGQQTLQLSQPYKPTIPITVRNFEFNRVSARHEVNRSFRKKVEFSDDVTEPEFIVDTEFNPPVLRLNGEYTDVVGQSITLSVSGTADPPDNDVNNLDIVGISNGVGGQEFDLTFSPVDPTQDVEVWTWLDPSFPQQWNVIDPLDEFSVSGFDVKVDKDRGTLAFGDHNPFTATGRGNIPSTGARVGAHYTTTIAAFYEPAGTRDDILTTSAAADVNPVAASTSRGFVQVTTESVDPASITLTSTLPQVNPFIIQLGNNIGEMIAEVKSASGDLLEGQEVTFQILDPQVGTFGATADTVTAITGADGQATALYNSPLTVQGLGQASATVTHDGSDTIIDVEGVIEPSTVSGIYLFKVHTEDDVLGIPEGELTQYYEDYIDEEQYYGTEQESVAYEQQFRTTHDLLKPTTYSASELSVGKKTLLLTTRDGVMNPHSGFIEPGILAPLFPSAVENIGTDASPILRMTYENILLPIPGTGDTKAYFAVGDAITKVNAFVTNQRTNRKIFSNTIELQVQVPDSVNGTFFCDMLNDIPAGLLTKTKNVDQISDGSIEATTGIDEYWRAYLDERAYIHVSGVFESYVEWFRRTRVGDTVGLTLASLQPPDGVGDPTLSGIDEVEPMDCPAEIPLGFRLKSTGITVASVLDQITFLDPNDNLPSGHFDV